MVLLKDSCTKEVIRERYNQLWEELLISDEKKAERVFEKLEYELLPTHQKFLCPVTKFTWGKILSPFKTHLTWIIPISVITFFVLAYVIFIWLSLWMED